MITRPLQNLDISGPLSIPTDLYFRKVSRETLVYKKY